jgi:hypothetical protein
LKKGNIDDVRSRLIFLYVFDDPVSSLFGELANNFNSMREDKKR